VLNYSNPIAGIAELFRVLRPEGLLILEYERSGSPEYWRTYGINKPCVYVETFYGDARTNLWAYDDSFIDGLLTLNGFETLRQLRFLGVPSLVLAVTGCADFAVHFSWADLELSNHWPFKKLASNRILAVKKTGNQ
jgi:SAM-dependent methyltransferase